MTEPFTIRMLAAEIIGELDAAAGWPDHPYHHQLGGLPWQTRIDVGDFVMAILARHDDELLVNDSDLPVEPLPVSENIFGPEFGRILERVDTTHLIEWLFRLDSDPRLEGLSQRTRDEQWWVFALCRSAEAADSLVESLRADGWPVAERFEERCVWLQPSADH